MEDENPFRRRRRPFFDDDFFGGGFGSDFVERMEDHIARMFEDMSSSHEHPGKKFVYGFQMH
ncbi:MAG: hypothetical protein NTU61_04380, partial [Candidatus Altiarchaeota archaeon]|nr:hypothetical protein [Candidatus Altiarchaeota archaeon]